MVVCLSSGPSHPVPIRRSPGSTAEQSEPPGRVSDPVLFRDFVISKSSSSLGSHRTPDPAGDPQGRLECRSRASEDGNGETGTTGETNNHRILVVALGKCDPGPENDDSDEKSTNSASGQKKHTHLSDGYIQCTDLGSDLRFLMLSVRFCDINFIRLYLRH